MTTPTDPMAMFRDAMTQWEKLANEYGGQLLARPEAAKALHTATAAGLQMQNAMQDAMAKVLAAANMPSKAEIEVLGQRIGAIEAALLRIEAQLLGGNAGQRPAAPRPTRGRKPPSPQ